MRYNILDVETTGIFPNRSDRIVEISILSVNQNGQIVDTFDTLVNPQRDIGPTHVHSITSNMVIDAPLFADIAPDVIDFLSEGAIVAHNASFDLRFLHSELQRVNYEAPKFSGICTLNLSRDVIPDLPSRKLEVLCNYFNVSLENAHAAYNDCLATKNVFLHLYHLYIEKYGEQAFQDKYYSENVLYKNLFHYFDKGGIERKKYKQYQRSEANRASQTKDSQLRKMMLRLTDIPSSTSIPVQEYLNLLDQILIDRIITEDEAEQLYALSEDYGITKRQAKEIHEEYIRRLVRVYLLDGIISDAERKDLEKVARLLNLETQLNLIIELEKANLPILEKAESTKDQADYAGKSVCFTGELCSCIQGQRIDRRKAQQMALERGLIVQGGVTKALDMLVVADPHTQSGKAKKARQYGTNIVAEAVFWRMLGIGVE